jgi:hypothetical protein
MTRATVTVPVLAAATVVLWLVVFPLDWSAVPTAEPQTYAPPLTTWHWAAAAAGLAALAFAGGFVRGPAVALLGVAVPAVALFCYRSATAEVIGANLWVVGALFLAPALAVGVTAAALLGRAVRKLRAPR